MIFLDSSFFIAFFREQDEDHQRAYAILQDIRESAITTSVVIAETLTFLKRKNGPKSVASISGDLAESNIQIADIVEVLMESLELFSKYDQFSFCDASSVAFMRKNGIKKIASFDSDFDLIPDIERIY